MSQMYPSPYGHWAGPAVSATAPPGGSRWALGLAVAALVTAFIALVVATLSMLGPWLAVGFDEAQGPSLTEGTVADLAGLQEGQCFSTVMLRPDTLEVRDCAERHDGEVYLLTTVGHHFGADYPGAEEISWAAGEECYTAFEDYTGQSYEESDYSYGLYAPDAQSWANGDREIACAIMPFHVGSLEGSIRAGS